MKKYLLLPVLALGLASAAFAGTACGSGCSAASDKPACKCGAKSADECHKHCGPKCDCAKQPGETPAPDTKK